MSLKKQAISGVLWNSFGKIFGTIIELVVGIILARLLTPKEFGLISTIMVLIAISQVFINSGFSQALVRKQDCTQKDFSTAFYFNLAVGLSLFAALYFSSGYISRFYNHPELKPLVQIMGLGLIISSLTLIQTIKIVKRIDFKMQTKISIIATIASGIIAVGMAFYGFGVWSLAVKYLTNQAIYSLLLWVLNRWRPELIFSISSFKELFGFGSRLLLSGLIAAFSSNIYYIIIGKYFSAIDLGYYTRAELFKNLPSQNISDISTSVGYPIMAKVQNDPAYLKAVFKKTITTTFFVVAILMFGMAAIAKSMIILLVGEQWRPSVIYLQILCFVGLLYPLNSINSNLLIVVGRSDLYLKIHIVYQLLSIPVVILGILLGIKFLLLGMCINSLIAYFYFSRISARFSGYPFTYQLKDILHTLFLATFMGLIVLLLDVFTDFGPLLTLILQLISGVTIVFVICEHFSFKEYIYLKTIFVEQYKKIFKIENVN